jgi:DNA-binding NarL/FixJ family response regulator
VELATIETADADAERGPEAVSETLDRVALELRAMSLSLSATPRTRIPLEHPELRELSAREQEVLVQLADGQRVATIARRLHISPSTVRNHLKAMYRKLGVHSQAELLEKVKALG